MKFTREEVAVMQASLELWKNLYVRGNPYLHTLAKKFGVDIVDFDKLNHKIENLVIYNNIQKPTILKLNK